MDTLPSLLLAVTLVSGLTCSGLPEVSGSAPEVAPVPQDWTLPLPMDQVRPHVLFDGQATVLQADPPQPWGRSYTVHQGGEVVAALSLRTEGDDLVLELLSGRTGSVQYALYISSPRLRTLDLHTTEYIAGNERHYYPYDWTETVAEGWLDGPELVSPGVMVHDPSGSWVVVAHHDTQLFKVDLRTEGSDKVARFFRQRESASGVDRATVSQLLHPGERDELRLTTSTSIRGIQRARLGSAQPMRGLITQVPHRGWGTDGGTLSMASYDAIASRLADGGISHVQLRLNEPEAWVSDRFVQQGLTTHYYMFLGVARLRRVDGVYCYSIRFEDGDGCVDGTGGSEDWMLRDGGGDIYTTAINPSWAFVDLRVPAWRQVFVDRAVRAIERGYGGIFFDGPHLWTGASRDVFTTGAPSTTRQTVPGDGVIGGVNAHGVGMSWYNARALLLREVRAAIRAESPDAALHEDAADDGVGSLNHGLPTQVKYVGIADFAGDAYTPDYTIPWADTIANVAAHLQDPTAPPIPSAACP